MERFEVDGTTLLDRTIQGQAHGEGEVGCFSDLRQDHALRDVHRVVGPRGLIETPAQGRIHRRPAAQVGDESFLAAHSGGGPSESRAAAFDDLIVIVIGVTAALLLDLSVYVFMASH